MTNLQHVAVRDNVTTPCVLNEALRLAKLGYYVAPVKVWLDDKCVKRMTRLPWSKMSTRDEATIRGWFAAGGRYADHDLLIDCGKSGIVVVDLDEGEGKSGAAEWKRLGGPSSKMVTLTRSGGHHGFYKADPQRPVRNSAGEVARGIDVRGIGGMVFAPPTVVGNEGGAYSWLSGPVAVADLAPAPTHLLTIEGDSAVTRVATGGVLSSGGADQVLRDAEKVMLDATEGENWNASLNHLAFVTGRYCGAVGESEDDAIERVVKVTGQRADAADGLDEESERTALRAIRQGIADPWILQDVEDLIDWEGREDDKPPGAAVEPANDEVFWSARSDLHHIRHYARAYFTSPWAVLGIVLARVIAATPPHVVLPANVGGQASLNLFVNLVGPSGMGKGGASRVAENVLNVGEIDSSSVGSGEGIAHMYQRKVKDPTTKRDVVEQYRDSYLFDIAEVDSLTALSTRQSSTLLPELRKVWMGERLGFAYVDKEKRLNLPAHSYRACVLVGVQPARAAGLFDDAEGGTPQRFLWFPVIDHDIPDQEPADPGPLPAWQCPAPQAVDFLRSESRAEVAVCDTARSAVKDAARARHRGQVDALDGHLLLCRLKAAAALGLLDGRCEVSEDDWELSGLLMAQSVATRNSVQQVLAEKDKRANVARAKRDAQRATVVEESVAESAVKRVTRKLVSKVPADAWVSGGDLRKSVFSRDRQYYEEAIERLLAAGQIEADNDGRTAKYRRVGGV